MICTKCNTEKPVDAFPRYKGKTGKVLHRKKCKECFNQEHLVRVYGNEEQREKKRQRDNKWRRTHREKLRVYYEDYNRRYAQVNKEQLTDRYILNRLGLRTTDEVPVELIEAKRYQILILRLLKEKGYEKYCRVAGRFV